MTDAVSSSLASPHGVRRLISPADNPGGVTVSNCCGTKIASVGVYTAGLQPNAATTGAVCRRCTGYRPTMGCGSDFYQIFPDRSARSLPREAEQDHVYYHHAAGQEIILRDWDEPVAAGGRINVLWRRSGRDKRKTAVSEKAWRDGAVSQSGV